MFEDGSDEFGILNAQPLNLGSVAVPFTFIANAQMIINALVNGYGDTPGLSYETLRDFIIGMHDLADEPDLTVDLYQFFSDAMDNLD